ncbi:MAG: flagellar hook-associated protein 3, partial [Lachnospiraceae bacterium]|nr:flagellar hook-associated protein 3 [Lachnospiraceae bacterium]
MRITNKVMQNNSLTNINKNKVLQDSLTTQLTTGKKINKPSEDPVTAIRALRLRSDVSQVTQFSKKNAPDAKSWLEITESSVKTTISVVKGMIEECEKGSNDTLKTEDRKIIIDSLKELRDEVYATGNADYAGRFLFTGYRTDTPLTFTENATENYHIWEQVVTSKNL